MSTGIGNKYDRLDKLPQLAYCLAMDKHTPTKLLLEMAHRHLIRAAEALMRAQVHIERGAAIAGRK